MKKERRHCHYCGEIIIKKEEDGVPRDYCPACRSFFYENPLPVVASILEISREILLVKRNRHPYKGYWCLPTGFAETGEGIEEAALRELREETGIKGRIVKLLDVDSYKSRFYGDLLFLTFVVEQVSGKLMAGDDSDLARFWPIHKLPALAFRPNAHAVETYIKSKRDHWAIFDAIEREDKQPPAGGAKPNVLTRRLIDFIMRNKDKIIDRWLADVAVAASTLEYRKVEQTVLYNICDKILSQISLWLSGLYDVDRIRNFFTKLGRERKREGFRISQTLSALSLIRKHIWESSLAPDAKGRNVEFYMTYELQRRMTIFFDMAVFYLTRGYEE
ncbi:MAG: NUDIX domain-containing protein [Deltaproteobacteria bacterium]|nr:NUDIX domain-containing protein [Deltaproteobacteria bacterium]